MGASMVGHSVALLASGFHVMADVLSYGLALWVHVTASRQRDAVYPYGWARMDVLGGLIIGVSMVSGSLLILLSSLDHLLHLELHQEGHVENSLVVFSVALAGVPVNCIGMMLFSGHSGHGHSHGGGHSHGVNQNLSGVFVHLASDMATSLLVAVAAAFMHFSHSPHRFVVDPIAGIILAVLTAVLNVPLIRSSSQILIFSNPIPDGNKGVEAALLQLPNVLRVDSLKVWQLDSPMSLVASCSLEVEGADGNTTLRAAHALLATLGIGEACVEVACEGTESECKRLQEANEALRADIGALNQVIGQMVENKDLRQPNSWKFDHETPSAAEWSPEASGTLWTPGDDSVILADSITQES
eukprot:TRINITY_DN23025_c0_g1_i1.p1 TRINITY_DN23025_c0_g1~~TRINITY_DN23025_c0_g1_i1.p1  ORF type:complete len:357 (+),score=76.92 TRINITY_DN23025_c0_g1_i1:337-1407(+)